jgi:hypothetical protein
MKGFFYLHFVRKSVTDWFKIWAKIFCSDKNGALTKKLHCYKKKSKLKFSLLQKNDSYGKNWGAKNLGKLLQIL